MILIYTCVNCIAAWYDLRVYCWSVRSQFYDHARLHLFITFNTVNKSECIKHVVFWMCIECLIMGCCLCTVFSKSTLCCVRWLHACNISFFTHMPNLCARNTHTRINDVSLQNSLKVDGDSWSQQYCRASGEMHWPWQDYQKRKQLARLYSLWFDSHNAFTSVLRLSTSTMRGFKGDALFL